MVVDRERQHCQRVGHIIHHADYQRHWSIVAVDRVFGSLHVLFHLLERVVQHLFEERHQE